MLALHTADERPYACDKCDQTFQDKSLLNMHKKIHSYEKPYLCHKCEKTFKHKSDLNKHIKIIQARSLLHLMFVTNLIL